MPRDHPNRHDYSAPSSDVVRAVLGARDERYCLVGSAGGTTALWAWSASGAALPPAAASNRACGSPAHGSPTSFTAGKRKRGSHRSAEAMDAHLGCPLVVEAGGPVAALESVLGAAEDREAFVDVAVDR
jgi:hypothetical protein